MRFGVFRLAYKTAKESEDGEAVKFTYRLVYRDNLGNQLTVEGTEDDYACAELGEIMPWETVTRQKTIEEAEDHGV